MRCLWVHSPEAVALVATLGALLMLTVCILVCCARRNRNFSISTELTTRQTLQKAIETTRNLAFHGAYVKASDFAAMGQLLPHETLRDRGCLVYKDTAEQLQDPTNFIVFMSHQARHSRA